MQLKEFKIRCSSINQIMTEPRSKSETLSVTCKTYVETWIKEQIYNTKKEVKSKYLTKGIEVEHSSIEYYAEEKGLGFVLQNTEYYENDFITGNPDLVLPDSILEFKSSWDCFTFPLFETQIDKAYEMQIQGYLNLTKKDNGKLIYCLINTPDELEWDETVDYSNMSSKYRIKEFSVTYDPEFIERVNDRVLECRDYINKITKTWK